MRIDQLKPMAHTARMDEDQKIELMDEAERLAIEVFGQHAEREHIEAVYERLLANHQIGLGWAGAVTVH